MTSTRSTRKGRNAPLTAGGVLLTIAVCGACLDGSSDLGRTHGSLELPFVLPTDAILPTQAVGTLPGSLDVSADGAATYSVPLEVPAGRAGMQPELSITYNSALGAGPLGVGFALHGATSTIERCVHPHEPGAQRRITFWADLDRFCLDGQPLLHVEGTGTNGFDGAEYRTEVETVQRITSHGTSNGGGPAYWVVEAADGRILRYSTVVQPTRMRYDTLDPSSPSLEGQASLMWSVSRIEDRFGNYMTYAYTTQYVTVDGEPAFRHRPREIRYTGYGAEPGLRYVRLDYQNSDSPGDRYVSGTRQLLDYELKTIRMLAPTLEGTSAIAWSYQFTYLPANSSITGRTLLQQLARCDALGACLPPTRFDWQLGSEQYQEIPLGTLSAGTLSTQLADVDGDGRDDLLIRNLDGMAHLWLYRGGDAGSWSGGFEYTLSVGPFVAAPIIADLNGDGRAELVGAEGRSCTFDSDCGANERCEHMEESGRGICVLGTVDPTIPCECFDGSPLSWTGPPDRGKWCGIPDFTFSTCPSTHPTCGNFGIDGVADCFEHPGSTPVLENNGWRVYSYSDQGGVPRFAIGGRLDISTITESHGSLSFADFSGDGAPDALRRDGIQRWSYGGNTGDPLDPFRSVTGSSSPLSLLVDFDPRWGDDDTRDEISYGAQLQLADSDADGVTNVLVPWAGDAGNPATNTYVEMTIGADPNAPEFIRSMNVRAHTRANLFIDANGDGLPDAVDLADVSVTPLAWPRHLPGPPRKLRMQMNTGHGFGVRAEVLNETAYRYFWPVDQADEPYNTYPPVSGTAPRPRDWWNVDIRVRVLDHNADGRQDFLVLGHTPQLYLSEGRSFRAAPLPFAFDDVLSTVSEEGTDFVVERRAPFLVGDVNGDDRPDFLHGETLTMHQSTGDRPDLLRAVTNGLGAAHVIEYSRTGDRTVYDRGLDDPDECGLPLACVGGRMPIVSALHYHNVAPHPARTIRFEYAGARRDARTRAFLGFTRMSRHDAAAGAEQETWYEPRVEYAPEGASMRFAYVPGARRPRFAYSAVRAGDRVSFVRTEYAYSDLPHPLLVDGAIDRGVRSLPREVITRYYDRDWTEWASCEGCTLDYRFRGTAFPVPRAWRVERVSMQYGGTACGAAEGDEPCSITSDPSPDFPTPVGIARAVYGTDELWPDDPTALDLHVFNGTVVEFEHDILERIDDVPSWLIGQTARHNFERCVTPVADSAGELRCPAEASPTAPGFQRHTVLYSYDQGAVESVIREPGAPRYDENGDETGLYRRTVIARDRGNVVEVQELDGYGRTRLTKIQYLDAERLFPNAVSVGGGDLAVGELTAWVGWHPALGVPLITHAPNGAETLLRYDGLGRPRQARAPGAAWVATDYVRPPSGLGAEIRTDGLGVVAAVVRLDELGRATQTEANGYLSAGPYVTDFHYDALGRLESSTRPYEAGTPAAHFGYAHDGLGRLTEVSLTEAGASTRVLATHTHELVVALPDDFAVPRWPEAVRRMRTTRTDAVGNEQRTWTGPTGRVELTEERYDDPSSGETRWIGMQLHSDLLGRPSRIERSSSGIGSERLREAEYDRLGRVVRATDADSRGERLFRYNAFDEVVWTRDSLGAETRFHRDSIGRIYERSGDYGMTNYEWDTADFGEGLMAASISGDGLSIGYKYDEHGRIRTEVHHAGQMDYAYDTTTGQLQRVTYPLVGGKRVAVEYQYDGGRLRAITEVASGATLWEALERHPSGRVRRERTLGGVVTHREYDTATDQLEFLGVTRAGGEALMAQSTVYADNGFMEHRYEAVGGWDEVFKHDTLGRLVEWRRTGEGGPARPTRYDYNDHGNLERIQYDSGDADILKYNRSDGAGLHAATEYNGEAIEYDRRGRMTRAALGRRMDYKESDLPTEIISADSVASIQYDANDSRVEMSVDGPEGVSTVHYVGRWYERRVSSGGTSHAYYVHGPGGVVAQIMQGADEKYLFYHRDGLGSVSLTTNERGMLVNRQWFGPFGRRFDAEGSPLDPVGGPSSDLTRGFTGHEHDDAFGLINAGGRIYDPVLRRFASPDPFVGAGMLSQSTNRYSYVSNSPMRFVDPSGLCSGPEGWTCTEGNATVEVLERPEPYGSFETPLPFEMGFEPGGVSGNSNPGGSGTTLPSVGGAWGSIGGAKQGGRVQADVLPGRPASQTSIDARAAASRILLRTRLRLFNYQTGNATDRQRQFLERAARRWFSPLLPLDGNPGWANHVVARISALVQGSIETLRLPIREFLDQADVDSAPVEDRVWLGDLLVEGGESDAGAIYMRTYIAVGSGFLNWEDAIIPTPTDTVERLAGVARGLALAHEGGHGAIGDTFVRYGTNHPPFRPFLNAYAIQGFVAELGAGAELDGPVPLPRFIWEAVWTQSGAQR